MPRKEWKHDWRLPRVQAALIRIIGEPHFSAALPPLSDTEWLKLLGQGVETSSEYHKRVFNNDRLEFFGDALMWATIGHQLLRQLPDGTPNMYTCIRSALHSNETFAFLAQKLDILAVSQPVMRALTARTFGEAYKQPLSYNRDIIKITADLFETLIAAYYLERGYEGLLVWVEGLYKPLIFAAADAFYDWPRGTSASRWSSGGRRAPHMEVPVRRARARTRSRSPPPRDIGRRARSRSPRPRLIKASASFGSSAVVLPVAVNGIKADPLLKAQRTKVVHPQSAKPQLPPVFIDLTLDDDDDQPSSRSSCSPPGLSAAPALPKAVAAQCAGPSPRCPPTPPSDHAHDMSQTSTTLSFGPESRLPTVAGTDSDDDSVSDNSESTVATMLLRDDLMNLDDTDMDEHGERSMDLGTESSGPSDGEVGWDDTDDLFIVN